MEQPVFVYVGHLSRRDQAVLEDYGARVHELVTAGETLDLYDDHYPLLAFAACRHYSGRGAARAVLRLAKFLKAHAELKHHPTEGRA